MSRIKIFFLVILLCFSLPMSVFADSGKSSIVMDINSGRILYSKDIHTKRLIASITKIMTCIIVLENSDLDKEIEIGEEVLPMYGTNIYIEVGEKMKIKDLLYGLMLRSGNDAAITLAVHTMGSEEEFVKKMNEKAQEIGMKDTTFENSHGLDDETKNYSTAYDMALLSRYAYQNNTFREIVSTKKYRTKSSTKSYLWYNRMSLLNQYKNCIGGKNGYTPKAGKTLVSYSKKDDFILTTVTLNDSDIYDNHINLYENIFKKYNNYLILDKKNFLMDSSFIDGNYYIKKSFSYPLREDEAEDVSTFIRIYPKPKKNIYGEVIIKKKDEEIGNISIYKKDNQKKEDTSIFQKFKKLIIR